MFILREENFSLKLMEKVSEPGVDECFLLYQAGAGPNMSMIISNGVKYSPTAVRRGHYNRKAVLSLKSFECNQEYRIVMVDPDFHFDVNVRVLYKLRDAQKYYFCKQMEDGSISDIVRESVRKQNKKWDVSQGWELQNKLEELIEGKLSQYEGVEFRLIVDVTSDGDALKMQKSNRDKVVGIHTSKNMTDQTIAINADKEKVAASEFKLKVEQLKELAFMIKNFGDLGPIVNEHLQGNVDGIELREYIMKSKTDEMNLLKMAMDTDVVTQTEALDKFNAILEGRRFSQTDQQLLGESRKEQEQGERQEEEERQEEQDNDDEREPYINGGFV